jgi:hypothetical protein
LHSDRFFDPHYCEPGGQRGDLGLASNLARTARSGQGRLALVDRNLIVREAKRKPFKPAFFEPEKRPVRRRGERLSAAWKTEWEQDWERSDAYLGNVGLEMHLGRLDMRQ